MDFTSSSWTLDKLSSYFRISESTIYRNATANYARVFSPDQVRFGSGGLHLTVSPPATQTKGSAVPCGGIYSLNEDFGYGSYHFVGKPAAVPGVVNAFFAYESDTQEIDLEYISTQDASAQFLRETTKPQIYTNGSPDPATYKTDSFSGTTPSSAFHEWAFKRTAKDVTFSLDRKGSNKITTNVPTARTLLAINTWSDGGSFSHGPPTSDATFVAQQVWGLYNSSTAKAPASSLNGQASKSKAMACIKRKKACYVKKPSGSNSGLSTSA